MPETGRVLSIAGFSDPVSSLTHVAGALVHIILFHGGWRFIQLVLWGALAYTAGAGRR